MYDRLFRLLDIYSQERAYHDNIMDMLRRVSIFVGMVVGAGFATGRELAMYFRGESWVTLVMTGVVMGLVYALFLMVGRSGSYQYLKNTHLGRIMTIIMSLALVASYLVMLSASEQLLFDVLGTPYLGVITGIMVAFVVTCGMRRLKVLSGILVPILVLVTLSITLGEGGDFGDTVSLMHPLEYVGMNMLMGGYLVIEDGEKVSNRDIALSGTIVAVLFSTMLLAIMHGIHDYTYADMPIYVLARHNSRGWLGVALIYIAILTTLLGGAKLIYDNARDLTSYRFVGVLFLILLAIMSKGIDFRSSIDIIYTIEGYIGVIFILYIGIGYAIMLYKSPQ